MAENGVRITVDSAEELRKAINILTSRVVMVGIPGDTKRTDGGPNNALLGYIHEFGSPAKNIPARPWLNPPIIHLGDEIAKMLIKSAQLVLANKDGEALKVLHALGARARDAVKNNMAAGGDPPFTPIAAATVAARLSRTRAGARQLAKLSGMDLKDWGAGTTQRTRRGGRVVEERNAPPLRDTLDMFRAINYAIRQK